MVLLFTLCRREWGVLMRSVQGVTILALLEAACGWSFVWLLRRYDGISENLAALWGMATAVWVPILAALAAMQGFSKDRATHMLALMFSSPVKLRTWVWAKVGGVMCYALTYLFFAWIGALCLVWFFFPAQANLSFQTANMIFVCIMLVLQSLLWASIATFASLLSRNAATSALATLFICCVLPPALYALMRTWLPYVRTDWAWFPLQAHVYDFAAGLISLQQIVGYLSISTLLIYLSILILGTYRQLGMER